MTVSLALDVLLAGLLIATLVYCIRLHRRLESIRGANDELRLLMTSFNAATEKARAGVAELKAASDAAGHELREAIERARGLADELSIMTQSGNRLADRLEHGLTKRSPSEPVQREPAQREPAPSANISASKPAASAARAEPILAPRSDAERELLQALRRVK